MKLIDLLNKIKNKENMPSEIIFDKGKFKWNTLERFYERGDGSDLLELCTIYNTDELLNMEVESIENEIEKIYCTNNKQGIMTKSSDDNEKEKELRKYIVNNCADIEELLRIVKQIDKRVKKLEENKNGKSNR